jgi:2-polyprenyl-3-methyl-5-hydroxy-6-metoxy-1,4-benzoquinol methylase
MGHISFFQSSAMKTKHRHQIIEKELGIKGDYQYQALKKGNFLQSNWHANKLQIIDYLLTKYQPKSVLDLGAGSGNLEFTFASKVNKILAVDYNDSAVDFLKKKLKDLQIKNVGVKLADLSDTKKIAAMGKFDLIIMVDVLEHLELQVSSKLITTFKKILNSQGVVVIITPNYQSVWPLLEKFVDRFTSIPDLGHCQHISLFTPQNITPPFIKKGFYCVKLSTFNTFSFLFPWQKLSTFLAKLEIQLSFPWGNLLLAEFKESSNR